MAADQSVRPPGLQQMMPPMQLMYQQQLFLPMAPIYQNQPGWYQGPQQNVQVHDPWMQQQQQRFPPQQPLLEPMLGQLPPPAQPVPRPSKQLDQTGVEAQQLRDQLLKEMMDEDPVEPTPAQEVPSGFLAVHHDHVFDQDKLLTLADWEFGIRETDARDRWFLHEQTRWPTTKPAGSRRSPLHSGQHGKIAAMQL